MKKLHVLFVLSLILFSSVSLFSQAVEQGTTLVDVYYGWPNLWTNTAKTALTDANSVDVKVGSMGPLGGRIEYMVSDKVGMGLDINYANTSVKWNEATVDGNGNNVTYNYDFSIPRFRALACFNLHFGASDKFDAYWKIGAGYSNLSWNYSTNDPDYGNDSFSFNYVPFALRTGIGGRFFFTENFGAIIELGVGGGPLMAFGLSAKF